MGALFSLFTLMKGLPSTYNRDLQEDKAPLFESLPTTARLPRDHGARREGLSVDREAMEKAVRMSFMPAVEMAEYLAARGVPFREAHHIVGRMVKACEEKKRFLWEMGLDEMRAYSAAFDETVFDYIDPRHVVENRKTQGGASLGRLRGKLRKNRLILRLLVSLLRLRRLRQEGEPAPNGSARTEDHSRPPGRRQRRRALLSFTVPTKNRDGTDVKDLAGFRIMRSCGVCGGAFSLWKDIRLSDRQGYTIRDGRLYTYDNDLRPASHTATGSTLTTRKAYSLTARTSFPSPGKSRPKSRRASRPRGGLEDRPLMGKDGRAVV